MPTDDHCSFRRQVDKIHDTWKWCSNPCVEGETVCAEHMREKRADAPNDALAKEIAEFWDNHCECYSKDFNREGYLREIIKNWLIVHDARVEARARLAAIEECVKVAEDWASGGRFHVGNLVKCFRELESAARESGGQDD